MVNLRDFEVTSGIESFFVEKTKHLEGCRETTRAYVTKVFITAQKEPADFSKESLTLVYAAAKSNYSFQMFQSLGDWILFAQSLYPNSLKEASTEYYNALAQDSYYRCYRLLNRQWSLFEELADTFPQLVSSLQTILIEPSETLPGVSQSLLIRT